jgi:SPOR domain
MSRVEAAAAMDRLPWLPDEPKPKAAKRRGNAALLWAAASIVAVAGAAFWMGARSVQEQIPAPSHHAIPTTTVRLPEPRPAEPAQVRIPAQPQVNPTPQPEVHPAPIREVRIAAPPAERAPRRETTITAPQEKAPEKAAAPAVAQTITAPAIAPANPQFVMPTPWNPRVFAGAAGRVVQIGAFGSTPQAKRGWRFMVRAYPAMAHLPAVVRVSRNSKGRPFYRFQVGTTSQAHSEVLCQRMQRIRFSCAVVGLPWKAKVER